jgi:uncharacterized repeat protein (TIGR01451 family)
MTRTSHSALTLAGLALLALSAPTTAYAQDAGPAAPDLAVAFDGPATAVAGSTAVWTLTVRNDGTAAAAGFTASTAVPAGVRVALRNAPDDWSTCVLGVAEGAGEVSVPSDLSCTYDGELPAGAQATVLPIDLSFDDALLGPQQIGAVVSPAEGESEDALANNRSSRTTTLSAPPVETTAPAAAPAAATPVTAAAATPPAVLPFTGVGTAGRTALGVPLLLAGIGLLLAGRARPALRTV